MSYFDEALIFQELLHTTDSALQVTELAKEIKKKKVYFTEVSRSCILIQLQNNHFSEPHFSDIFLSLMDEKEQEINSVQV